MKESKSSLVSSFKGVSGGSESSSCPPTVSHKTGIHLCIRHMMEKSPQHKFLQGRNPCFLTVAQSCNFLWIFHVCRIRAMLNCCQENRKVRLKLCEFSFLPMNLLQQLTLYLETENKAQKNI